MGKTILRRLLLFISLLAILVVGVSYVFGTVVEPGFFGVRQIMFSLPFGPRQGFSEKALPSGYHWSIPFYSRVLVIPRVAQLLHLHRKTKSELEFKPALVIQTTDGSSVLADISIIYRFLPQKGEKTVGGKKIKHGGASDLIQKVGLARQQWISAVYKVASDELKRSLGSLATSQFYDPHKRESEVLAARDNMNLKLLPWGIYVDAVLFRRYTYEDSRIDEAVFLKNLQDQEERLNAAASKLAEARAKLEQIAAEWDAKIKTLKMDGENKAKVIRSEGELYFAEKKAEGDYLVQSAIAEADRLKAEAYGIGEGSDLLIARDMLGIFKWLRGGIVSDVDLFDIDDLLSKMGVNTSEKR